MDGWKAISICPKTEVICWYLLFIFLKVWQSVSTRWCLWGYCYADQIRWASECTTYQIISETAFNECWEANIWVLTRGPANPRHVGLHKLSRKDGSNARPIHVSVFSINNNHVKLLPKSLPIFWYQIFITGPRADNVLCNFYNCDLAISGVKLENVKVPSKNKLPKMSEPSSTPPLRVHGSHARQCTNNYPNIHTSCFINRKMYMCFFWLERINSVIYLLLLFNPASSYNDWLPA